MSGFVYIWFDRKRKRYYIGSHWGSLDDGYICSSNWMRDAYRRRPEDFRRRIISTVTTNRKDLLQEEQRWIDMIKPEEIKVRYYNLHLTVGDLWHSDPNKRKTVGQKISEANKGKSHPQTAETRAKISASRMGISYSQETIEKMSRSRMGVPSPMKGKQFSVETREKMSIAKLGRTLSQKTKDKMSLARKGLRWYTNGINNYRLLEGLAPSTLRIGRTV